MHSIWSQTVLGFDLTSNHPKISWLKAMSIYYYSQVYCSAWWSFSTGEGLWGSVVLCWLFHASAVSWHITWYCLSWMTSPGRLFPWIAHPPTGWLKLVRMVISGVCNAP